MSSTALKKVNNLTSLKSVDPEHLSAKVLKDLTLDYKKLSKQYKYPSREELSKRPNDLAGLMDWAENCFGLALSDTLGLQQFLHSTTVINGLFYTYCQENKIDIVPVFNDSIASWKDEDNEHYFCQGVFLIKTKDTEYLQCSLFHKSTDNEDEPSSFVIVSNKNYEGYLKIRNDFEDWMMTKDQSNLTIKVADGDDIHYKRDHLWDDLFLPKETKTEIKEVIENFLNSKDFYEKNNIAYKRGVILHGPPGNGKSTIIRTIISEYNFKPITISFDASIEALYECFHIGMHLSPALIFLEDLDLMIEHNFDLSSFLNILDGVYSKDGIFVIATTNNIKSFKSNIIQRPGRFDRKFEIKLPDQTLAENYLNKWFKNLLPANKVKELAKNSVKERLSFSHLKELYISSMYNVVSNNRKSLTEKDVLNAFNIIVKDKNIGDNNSNIDTNMYFK